LQRTCMSLWDFTVQRQRDFLDPILQELRSDNVKPFFDTAVKVAINRIKYAISIDVPLNRTHSTCNFVFSFPRAPCSLLDVCRLFFASAQNCEALEDMDKEQKIVLLKAVWHLQVQWRWHSGKETGTTWLDMFRVHFIKRLTKELEASETNSGYKIQERITKDVPKDWTAEIAKDIPPHCIRVCGCRYLNLRQFHNRSHFRHAALGCEDEMVCVWTTANWSDANIQIEVEHVWFMLQYAALNTETAHSKTLREKMEKMEDLRSEEPEKKKVKREENVPDMPSGAQVKVEPDAQD